MRRVHLSAVLAVCTTVVLARRWRRGAAPCRRLETLRALQEPISPNRPTRRGVTTRNLPSATGPRKRAGSIRRRRRSKQRRTSAARAQRRVFYGAAINPTARRQRGGLLPALPVRFELHVRHGAPRVRRAASPLNLCLRSPEVARALARGLRRALRAPGGPRGERPRVRNHASGL